MVGYCSTQVRCVAPDGLVELHAIPWHSVAYQCTRAYINQMFISTAVYGIIYQCEISSTTDSIPVYLQQRLES